MLYQYGDMDISFDEFLLVNYTVTNYLIMVIPELVSEIARKVSENTREKGGLYSNRMLINI